jgi:hypothetical protein
MMRLAKVNISPDYLNHIYDVLHFVVRTREVRVVTATWYRAKFKRPSRDAADRAWDRFKERVKLLKIPFEIEDVYETEDQAIPLRGLKFILPDAWEHVERLVSKFLPDEEEDEPGSDNRDRGADRGDRPVLVEGRAERHGDVPVRGVDPQQGTRLETVVRHPRRRR